MGHLTCSLNIFLTRHENENISRRESKVNGEDLGSDAEEQFGMVWCGVV